MIQQQVNIKKKFKVSAKKMNMFIKGSLPNEFSLVNEEVIYDM